MSLLNNITEFANKLAASKVNHVDLGSPMQIARLGEAFIEVAVATDDERAITEDRLITELEHSFAPQ